MPKEAMLFKGFRNSPKREVTYRVVVVENATGIRRVFYKSDKSKAAIVRAVETCGKGFGTRHIISITKVKEKPEDDGLIPPDAVS